MCPVVGTRTYNISESEALAVRGYVFPDLAADTTYVALVCAVNAVGPSSPRVSAAFTTLPASRPSSPVRGSVGSRRRLLHSTSWQAGISMHTC